MQIELIKSVDEKGLLELIDVYTSAGWWGAENEDNQLINRIIGKSFCFFVAKIDSKIVGMGRSISDGVCDAYIQDVAVLPDHQGMGIGKMIVQRIVEYLQQNQITWIGLIATPNADAFYGKLGFSVMENFTPMIYSSPKEE